MKSNRSIYEYDGRDWQPTSPGVPYEDWIQLRDVVREIEETAESEVAYEKTRKLREDLDEICSEVEE